MSKTEDVNIGTRVPPTLRDRIDRVAKRRGMSRAEFIRSAVDEASAKAEREHKRLQRRIEHLPSLDYDELEKEESRLLERVGQLSEEEQRYLDAVQDELLKQQNDPIAA